MSEKFDGFRAFWDGASLWSKQGKLLPAPEAFTKVLPRDIKLDGEIWYRIRKVSHCLSSLSLRFIVLSDLSLSLSLSSSFSLFLSLSISLPSILLFPRHSRDGFQQAMSQMHSSWDSLRYTIFDVPSSPAPIETRLLEIKSIVDLIKSPQVDAIEMVECKGTRSADVTVLDSSFAHRRARPPS